MYCEQEVKKEFAARRAEEAALRSALRHAQANSPPEEALAALQAELAQMRWDLPALKHFVLSCSCFVCEQQVSNK